MHGVSYCGAVGTGVGGSGNLTTGRRWRRSDRTHRHRAPARARGIGLPGPAGSWLLHLLVARGNNTLRMPPPARWWSSRLMITNGGQPRPAGHQQADARRCRRCDAVYGARPTGGCIRGWPVPPPGAPSPRPSHVEAELPPARGRSCATARRPGLQPVPGHVQIAQAVFFTPSRSTSRLALPAVRSRRRVGQCCGGGRRARRLSAASRWRAPVPVVANRAALPDGAWLCRAVPGSTVAAHAARYHRSRCYGPLRTLRVKSRAATGGARSSTASEPLITAARAAKMHTATSTSDQEPRWTCHGARMSPLLQEAGAMAARSSPA